MKIIIKFGYLFIFINLFALSMSEEVVEIIEWRINSDDQMEISYYLHSPDRDKTSQYYVIPMVSVDNGKTWFKLASLEGNYGLQTSSRSKKMIFWDIFNDRAKLDGYVRVKLIAKPKKSILKEIFSISKSFFTSSQNMSQKKSNLGVTLSGFNIDFPNSTYKKNIDMGVIEKRKFPFTMGINVQLVETPIKFLLSVRQGEYNINQPVPYIDYGNSFWVVTDSITTVFDSNGLYNSNEEVEDDDFYRFAHQSISASWLYSPIPNINYFSPFFGLGLQLSRIQLYEIPYINNESYINDANTSDLFWVGSIDFNSKLIIVNVTYQESIFRQLRKWNELSVNLGIKLD